MPPRKKMILLFLALFLTALSAAEIAACTCFGRRVDKDFQPCRDFNNADVIFIGTAKTISIRRSGTGARQHSTMLVQFAVEKPIRGVKGKTVVVETSASTSMCGYPFEKGKRYFAYFYRSPDGKLSESLCGSTVPLENAAVDLEYLKAVENGEKGGRVFGNIVQMLRKSFKDQDEILPVAGTKIILTSVRGSNAVGREQPKYEEREFQTQADDKGFYLFRNVPAGLYKVRAEFQNGLREISTPGNLTEHQVSIDEDKKRCGSYNFTATRQGSVEGRVVGSDGQTPPPQYISLTPIEENGKARLDYTALSILTGKESGRFYFNAVPPGKYLLAINPKNCPSGDRSEFGRMFLPGVAGESEAEIISVAENERKTVPNFRLLPPLKERIFSGIVLSANKTPVSGAKVFLIGGSLNNCGSVGGLGETKTDKFGRFQIKGYESYEYKIKAIIEKRNPLFSELIDIPITGNFENMELILSETYIGRNTGLPVKIIVKKTNQ
jgi:hypothetical protein